MSEAAGENIDNGANIEVKRPSHLERLYQNLAVLPVLEVIPPQPSTTTEAGQERNDTLEKDCDVIHKTRIALSAIEAWARKGSTEAQEIIDATAFANELNRYVTSYTDLGKELPSDFIDRAAERYITEDIVDSIYGGNEDHKMLLDSSESVIKETATIIGHDIRTPFTSLRGRVSMLERATSPEIQARTLSRVQNSINELLNETIYCQDLLEGGFTKDEFTVEQIADTVRKYLGESTIVRISDEAKMNKIISSDKWFSRLLTNAKKNTDEQYEIRDEQYPNRKGEVMADGTPTKGKMIVDIDVVEDDLGDKHMQITVGDIATGFTNPKRLREGFVLSGTDKKDRGGTGMGVATVVAIADKLYRYQMNPQTVIRNSMGEVIKIIEYIDRFDFESGGREQNFIESEIKNGKVISERKIEEDEVNVANTAYTGAQTVTLAPLIK